MVRRRAELADLPPEPPKPVPIELLRIEARQIYVTAVEKLTAEDVWRHPTIRDKVAFGTVRAWMKEDKWLEARAELQTGIARKLEGELRNRLFTQVAQDRSFQKRGIRKIMKHLLKETLESGVKSADAGARAFAELAKADNILNESIAGDLKDVVQAAGVGGARTLEARTGMTQDEILAASRHILAQRRAERTGETIDVEVIPSDAQGQIEAEPTRTFASAVPTPTPPVETGGG